MRMKVLHNEDLSKYTTIKIGGIANNFYIPETQEELINLVKNLKNFRILGGGSNLLINDTIKFNHIIYTKEFNKKLSIDGDVVTCGASVTLQKLITYINDHNYGGIEYLYSVPGYVGGAIYMNAGRGKSYNKSITDYLLDVKVLHQQEIKILSANECFFSYRSSIFQYDEYIILEARFKFEKKDKELCKQERIERLKYSKTYQDTAYPNFGTVFSICNDKLLKISRMSFKFNKDKIQFSNKSLNWLINNGGGKYMEAIKRIERTKAIHNLFKKKINVEVRIWND